MCLRGEQDPTHLSEVSNYAMQHQEKLLRLRGVAHLNRNFFGFEQFDLYDQAATIAIEDRPSMAPRGAWEPIDALEITDLLNRLEPGRSPLDQDRIERLITSDVAPCTGSCKSNVRNPHCFCGLVPPVGSFRKKGLWQKDSAVLGSIGRDPADEAKEVQDDGPERGPEGDPVTHAGGRQGSAWPAWACRGLEPMPIHCPPAPSCSHVFQDPSTPAGLRNLGNTCYVNTALQCLFSIPAFKSALLKVQR